MRINQINLRGVGPFDDVELPLKAGTNPDLADVYLLTGPNGSGKSTALYSLAGMIGCGHGNLGTDLGALRLRNFDSLASVIADEGARAAALLGSGSKMRDMITIGPHMLNFESGHGFTAYYKTKNTNNDYWQQAHNFRIDAPIEVRPKFSWAAFAYAGMRSVSDAKVTAIQEPDYSPFEQSLSFVRTANTDRLAQWIANQDFKRLKAKEAGRTERSEQLNQSVRDIERVVSEIIDEDFAFVTTDDDNNIRARRNGIVTELGLLPDGLKSIVSWIADLLMRLDRIPWVDSTPPMKRPFLLLLDEVDIHLHPSWQRKVLPIVQKLFPNAQIIASTHSPFVVASADDAQIITLKVTNGVSSLEHIRQSQTGISYSAVLRSIFGIDSEFDIETERAFSAFHEIKQKVLIGNSTDIQKVRSLADDLALRGEEVAQLVAIELRQFDRQLATIEAK